MYDHLFHTLYPQCSIYTRTWSTNAPHSRILSKFSFEELARLENDACIHRDDGSLDGVRWSITGIGRARLAD